MSKDWIRDLQKTVLMCEFIPFATREKLSNGLLILPDEDLSRLIDILAKLLLKENIRTLDEIAKHHEAARTMRDLIHDMVKNKTDEGGKANGS